MTRRERAALALALEVLRGGVMRRMQWAADILIAEDACAPVTTEVWEAVAVQAAGAGEAERSLIRARLAIYLRARLRVDAGWHERTPWWCMRCGALRCQRWECEGSGEHTRITPLWQQAPVFGHWRHDCFRCGLTIDLPRGEACAECGDRDPRRGGA